MIGIIIGDICGSIFEFTQNKEIPEHLIYQESQFTDDTLTTIITADILMNNKPIEETFQIKCRQFPKIGFGGMFLNWIFLQNPQPYNSYGNGAVMRISPIPYLTNSLEECLNKGKAITKITHNHPYSFRAIECYLTLLWKALKEKYTKEQLKEIAINYYPEINNLDLEDLNINYEFNETCQGSVPQALFAFFESSDYESCLKNTIYIGGDVDTTACIAGGLAEAFYKEIPTYLIKGMLKKIKPIKYFNSILKQFIGLNNVITYNL